MNNIRQTGLSVVELLLAIVLSTSLAAAVYQIVINNRVNVTLIDNHSKIQESARLAIDLLSRDLRMAGFMGCVSTLDNATSHLDQSSSKGFDAELYDFSSAYSGIDNVQLNVSNPTEIGGVEVKPGTDTFTSRSASTIDLIVESQPNGNGANIKLADKQRFARYVKEGSVLMVTDCVRADIFAVSNTTGSDTVVHNKNVTGGPDNVGHVLNQFSAGSQALIMNSFSYFIGESSVVTDASGDPVNSLYRYSILDGDEAVELVPYVDDLQLVYGLDDNDDGNVDSYDVAPAASVAAAQKKAFFEKVRSVQYEIIMSGTQDVNAAPYSGNVAGATAPDDGKIRKRYSGISLIRNQTLRGGTLKQNPGV